MDNQQGKNPETRAAWLAGFMDGEGSFCLRANNGGWRMPQPLISVSNTHMETLAHLREVLSELDLPYHVQMRQKSSPLSKLVIWQISLTGSKRCKRWCEALLPYLVTKHSKAEALLEWCDERLAQSIKVGLQTDRQQQLCQFIRFGSQPSQTTRGTGLISP